jgi:hypothetical protein
MVGSQNGNYQIVDEPEVVESVHGIDDLSFGSIIDGARKKEGRRYFVPWIAYPNRTNHFKSKECPDQTSLVQG